MLIHSMSRLLCFIFSACLLFISCQRDKKLYFELAGKAQGTTFKIHYQHSSPNDFSDSIDSLFRLIDKSMSLWDSTSLISRINRNEPGTKIDEHFRKVLIRALEISESTGGAFDVTVSPLVKAWGFSIKKGLPLPDSLQVDSLMKLIGYQKIKLVNDTVQKDDPGVELDFNAIAQGYTVDFISKFLEEKGVKNYLVELGGEVRASGINERDSIWVIGIDKPVENTSKERPLQTTVILKNKSLATSGSYRKFIESGGKKLGHVIDPSTGYPVIHKMVSVSVIANDCMTADAYATAFLVMGMEKALQKATEMKMGIYCIYVEDNGDLSVRSTPGFGF